MNKMQRILSRCLAIVMLGALLLNAPLAGASSVVLRFVPEAGSVGVGEVLVVHVQIDNVSDLAGAELHMSYNSALLEVVDSNPSLDGVQIAAGSFLQADFVAQNSVTPDQGKIDFSVLQLPPHGAVSGSGILASISFRGKAAGASALTFNAVNLANGSAGAIAAAPQNGQLTVGGVAAPTATSQPVYPTATSQPVYPTATWQPVYPTATPQPFYPTATWQPVYPTATPQPGYPTPAPSAGILGYHTVRRQETLFCIGRAYGVLPWAIASANGVAYPYRLNVNQVLSIPNVAWSNPSPGPVCPAQFGGGQPAPTPVPQPTSQPAPSGCRAIHIVQRGETLFSIARRYGTTIWAMTAANSLANPNLIFPGQRLCVP